MSLRPATFTGRVLLDTGAAAYGCRVVLTIGDTMTRIAETWTSASGEFVLTVPRGRLPAGGDAMEGFTLEVIDGTGTVLVRKTDLALRNGTTTRVDFTAQRRTMVTLPVALPLTRSHAGTILRPEALAVIDAALALLAPVGSPTHDQYMRAVHTQLPPSGHVQELLDLAWEAIDGDPRSMADLREVLAVQSATVRRDVPVILAMRAPQEKAAPRRKNRVAYGISKEMETPEPAVDPMTSTGRLLSSTRRGTASDDGQRPRESAVSTERLLPLLVATVRISRSTSERVAFFDGLHGLLSGLSTIDRLYRAALDVLQERRVAPLRALLALLLANVGSEGDLPLPTPGGLARSVTDPNLPDLVDPWWLRLQECVQETLLALKEQQDGEAYRITEVEPVDGGPGTLLTLHGHGFGDTPGEVVFGGVPPVPTAEWTDERIRVVVPEQARPGAITLRVLEGVIRVQRKLIEYYREGESADFEGGTPSIQSVLADGKAEGSWVLPGEPVAISWTTIVGHGGRIQLQVHLRRRGEPANRDLVLYADSDLAPSGSRILSVPEVDEEHQLIVRVRVQNPVHTVQRDVVFPVAIPPRLSVVGIEVTQGIQRSPLGDVAEPAVPTIAGKDTMVRVYVSSEREGFQDDHARIDEALLRIGDVVLSPLPQAEDGEPTPFEAGRRSAIDRSDRRHSLAFRIPAALCTGTRELHVEVWSAGRPPNAPHAEARLTWTWKTVRALPVRYVRLGTRLGRPSQERARATLVRAFDLLPTPPDDIGPAWADTWDAVAVADERPDDPGWSVVLDELGDLHDGSAWEWLASQAGLDLSDEPEALWVGVVDGQVDDHISDDRRTVLATPHEHEDPADAPSRTATARVLAHALDPQGADLPDRIDDVPFDPHGVVTVVDPVHGVHDLSPPPGRAWISAARWRRLLERV